MRVLMSGTVDETDWRLLVKLTRDPFATYDRLGRAAGVTSTTAKRRLDAMRERGAYDGVRLRPTARAFGKDDQIWPFVLGENGFPEPDALLGVDEVVWCSRVYDGVLIVGVHAASPEAGPPPELVEAVGCGPVYPVAPGTSRAPEGTYPLSSVDWRVVKVLVETPRATITELAERCGLSARTVRSRRESLASAGVLKTSLALDVSREAGDIAYNLYVNFGYEDAMRGFRLERTSRVHQHEDPPGLVLLGLASTYPEANGVEKRARSQPGVVDARLVISQGTFYATEKLTDWIRAEIDRWEEASFSRGRG